MSSSPGHPAALPAKGYTRPKTIDPSGLVVTHTSEDGTTTTRFDFRAVNCPAALRTSLVQGFANACGQGGRWRSPETARASAVALRRFIREIGALPESPDRIEDLGPDSWIAWRHGVTSKCRWSGVVSQVRTVLLETPGLRDDTRKSICVRLKKPKTRLFDAYSRDEFQRIRAAASRIVRTGEKRIAANTAVLQRYYDGTEPDDSPSVIVQGVMWKAGSVLDHLARTGSVPTCFRPGGPAAGAQALRARALLSLEGAFSMNEALFPNSIEIFSLSLLFVCERGYNRSVIKGLKVGTDRADDHATEEPVHLLHLDKPRRGPSSRFSAESLTGSAGRLFELATSLTEQTRKTLSFIGSPTDSLLVHRLGRNVPSATGAAKIFSLEFNDVAAHSGMWNRRANLSDDKGEPLQVTHQRLRLTEQVLNQQPRQNSPTVSEEIYRRADPQTQTEAATAIIQGQEDALDHARTTVTMRTLTAKDIADAQRDPRTLADRLGVPQEKVRLLIAGSLNTVLGACLDFTHSPFAENDVNCPASFLACLGCSNAVATPEHVPRLVGLRSAMERLASAITQTVWDEDYAATHARLTDLLESNTTPEQQSQAVSKLSDDDAEVISRLLSRGLDI